jgi:hypothetical protein
MAKQIAKHTTELSGMEAEADPTTFDRWLWMVDMPRSRREGGKRGKHRIRFVNKRRKK